MSTATRATETLLRIRDRAKAGEPLAEADASYFSTALEQWLGGTDFSTAFGVKPNAGEGDPRRLIAEGRRDELIRLASRQFLAHLPLSRHPAELHRVWLRQVSRAASGARGGATERMYGPTSTLDGLLARIIALRPRVLSERQIRRILARGSPHSVAREKCSHFIKQETVREEGTLHGT